ncbi:MAG: hypothetical protein Q4G28_02345 [Neisseria sp.]|nr:hypothetical protein [Neisseria sp.]
MKWLFAVLVALNIIVFGGMVAGRVAEKQKTVIAPAVPMVSGTQELRAPTAVYQHIEETEASSPEWVSGEVAAMPEAASDAGPDEAAEREKKAREEKLAREKKAREEREKRAQAQQEGAPAAAAGQGGQCHATASVTLDEDDYHRIKGLLNKWPHAATRTVEKRQAPAKKAAAPAKSYRVLLPSGGDAIAQLDNLAAQGFTGSLHNGEISVGVVRSKSAAQVLMSRLAGAGFGGARVSEQEESSAVGGDSSLSVSRMQVLFMSVDDKDARAIQAVVGKYGRLNRNACR